MIDLTTIGLIVGFGIIIYLVFTKNENKNLSRKSAEIFGIIALTFILNRTIWKINFWNSTIYIWITILLALFAKGVIAYIILKLLGVLK